MTELLLPKILGGRYQLTQQLGQGVFSDTYLAKDRQLPDRPICVVKCLKAPQSEAFNWARARSFFQAEAQVLYRLSQYTTQVPRLLAHFEEDQQFYLVQEYIEGADLSQELSPGRPLPERQVIELMIDMLQVLATVHAQGVIHRDIKPHNLIRRATDRKIVLIDFGAVKQLSTQVAHLDGQTTESILIGTPGYMAGEQRAGKPRFCSDVYSVGILGIQALTGLNPKEIGEDRQGELCWRQMAQVSPRLAAVLTKMVRSHWRDRYPSVQSVLLDLQGLRSQASPASHSEPLLKRMALLTAAMMLMGGISQVPNVQHIMRLGLAAIATWMPDSIVSVPLSQTSDGMIVPLKMVDSESGSVLAIAMHPRGKVAASGGKNKLIQLWDVESGVMLNDLTGHLQEISALSFAPDGATLASGSGDATVKIWDLKSGVLRHTLVGHQGRVNAVQITPDGRWAVSGGSDRRIKIWDLASGKEQQTLTGHEGAIQTLEISSDGNFLFSGSQDKTIRVWELSTGRVVQTLTGHRSGVDAIAITPDNQTLISGAEDQIIVWDRFTGKKARTFTQSVGTHALRFSEDGRYLLSAHTDGTLKVWNWQTGSLIKTVRGHSDDVTAIAICRNYRTLVTASLDHRLGIWRLHL